MATLITSQSARLRAKWHTAFTRLEVKAARLSRAFKAGFDPNQPRVPGGNPDGGRWTGGGGAGGGTARRRLASATSPKKPKLRAQRHRPQKRRPSPVKKLNVPVSKSPATKKGPLSPPPRITKRKPPNRQLETRIAREVGKWLLKAAVRRALGPIGIALDVIDGVLWLRKHYPDIQSYFDEPKPLKELQDAVSDPLVGYEIHHIVERATVEHDGIGHDRVNTRENLVRISAWKHHEITAWYMTRNEKFGDLSPRGFLHGKSWEEKYRVGLKALKDHGVLKP